MKYLKYLALVILILLAAGCGTKDPISPGNQVSSDIMPLKVGNAWTYDFKVFQPNNPTPIYDWTWTEKVVSSTVINDTTWFLVYHIMSDGVNADTMDFYYTNRTNGLWVRSTPAATPSLRAKYPATQSETFQAFNELYFGIGTMTVISTAASVTVPRGSYSCYHYRMNPDVSLIINDYFRPGLGWVKSEWQIYDAVAGWYTYFLFELRTASL